MPRRRRYRQTEEGPTISKGLQLLLMLVVLVGILMFNDEISQRAGKMFNLWSAPKDLKVNTADTNTSREDDKTSRGGSDTNTPSSTDTYAPDVEANSSDK